MKKNKKKLSKNAFIIRIFTILSLITLFITSILSPIATVGTITVQAKEETKDSEDKDSKSDEDKDIGMKGGNVLGNGVKNPQVFLNYARYDKRVQLALTYNILKDSYARGTNYDSVLKGSAFDSMPVQFKTKVDGGLSGGLGEIMSESTAGEGTEESQDNTNKQIKSVVEKELGKDLREMAKNFSDEAMSYDNVKKVSNESEADKELSTLTGRDTKIIYYNNESKVTGLNAVKIGSVGNFDAGKDLEDDFYKYIVQLVTNTVDASNSKSEKDIEKNLTELFEDKRKFTEYIIENIWGSKSFSKSNNTPESKELTDKYSYSKTTVKRGGFNNWVTGNDNSAIKVKTIDESKFTDNKAKESLGLAGIKTNQFRTGVGTVGIPKNLQKNKKISSASKELYKAKNSKDAKVDSEVKEVTGGKNLKGVTWTVINAEDTDDKSGKEGTSGRTYFKNFFYNKDFGDSQKMYMSENGYKIGGSNGESSGGVPMGDYLGMYGSNAKSRYDKKMEVNGESPKNNTILTSVNSNLGATSKGFAGTKVSSSNGDNVVGIDNYGNIISATTGVVLIPYWKNNTISEFKDFDNFMSDNAFGNMDKNDYSKIEKLFESYVKAEQSSEYQKYKSLANSVENLKKDLQTTGGDMFDESEMNKAFGIIESAIGKGDTSKSGQNFIYTNLGKGSSEKQKEDEQFGLDGETNDSKGDTADNVAMALAILITASTYQDVRKFTNDKYQPSVKKTNQMFVSLGNAGDNTDGNDDDVLARFTAAGILQQIGMILTVGFGNLLRLSVASRIISFYNSDFLSFGLNNIFHTGTIFETDKNLDIIKSIAIILATVMGFLLLWWGFSLVRTGMKATQIIFLFVMATLTMLFPLTYNKLIDTMMNKPSTWVIGQQLKQTSILDMWVTKKLDFSDDPDKAEMMKYFYGMSDTSEKTSLIMKNRELDYTIYFPTTLLKTNGADVTSDDIEDSLSLVQRARYLSIKDKSTGNQWGKNDLKRVGVTSFDLKRWAEEMKDKSNDQVTPLFEWLTENDEQGLYKDLSGDNGVIKEMPIDMNKYFNDQQKSVLGRKDTTNGFKGEGSLLFLEIYRSNLKNADFTALANIDKAMNKTDVSNNGKKANLSKDAKDMFINDISKTKESRQVIYNGSKSSDKENPFAVSTKLLADDVGMKKLPDNDFLGIGDVVNKLVTFRESNSGSNLNSDIYEINKTFLNNYLTNYAKVRESVSPDGDFDKAESFAMSLETFFILNNKFNLRLLPSGYESKTITFDSYVRLIFIPRGEFNPTNPYTSNVAGYLANKEQILPLILFALSLLAFLIFGYTYYILFYFVMLVIVVFVFFMNYIIKKDTTNDAWKGILIILAIFGGAKLGLMSILWAMNTYLNYSFTQNGGVTMPYVLIYSSIIIVYIWLVFTKIFSRVFKAVIKDFNNLGANSFKEGFNNFKSKGLRGLARAGLGGAGRGLGKHAGRGVKVGKFGGRQLKNVVTGEGKLGRLSHKTVDKLHKSASKVAVKTGLADKMDNIDMRGLRRKMEHGSKKTAMKIPFAKGIAKKLPSLTTFAMASALESKKYRGNVLGDDEEEFNRKISDSDVGESLASLSHNKMATFTYENEDVANAMQGFFERKGYKSKRNGRVVTVNTNGLDISTLEARKSFYDGSQEYLEDLANTTNSKLFSRVKDIKKGQGIYNYTESEGGNIEVKVGGRDGLNRETFDILMKNSAFYKNFELDGDIGDYMSYDGYIKDNSMISLKPRSSVTNVEGAVRKLFKSDNSVRLNNGYDQVTSRDVVNGNNKTLQLAKSGTRTNISKILKDNDIELDSNMLIQDGAILYDENNTSNLMQVEKIRKVMREEKRKTSGIVKNTSANILSATTTPDINAGFRTTLASATDDVISDRDRELMKDLNISKSNSIKTNVLATKDNIIGTKVGNIVKSLKGLGNEEGSKMLVDYTKYKDAGIEEANRLLLKGTKSGRDFYKGSSTLLNTAVETGALDRETSVRFGDELKDLERNRNMMPDSKFKKESEILYKKLKEEIASQGKQDSVYLDILYRSDDASVLDTYEKYKDNRYALKEKGVSEDLIEKVDVHNINDIIDVKGTLSDVKVLDKTVELTTEGEQGNKAVSLIQELIKGEKEKTNLKDLGKKTGKDILNSAENFTKHDRSLY